MGVVNSRPEESELFLRDQNRCKLTQELLLYACLTRRSLHFCAQYHQQSKSHAAEHSTQRLPRNEIQPEERVWGRQCDRICAGIVF
jgi:hypothetical protein